MIKKQKNQDIVSGTWYYFTVDLNFKGFRAIRFKRYIDVNGDRMATVVEMENSYFSSSDLILLPYNRETDYFNIERTGICSVWTFDGSDLGDAESVDLQANWPHNILDKAAITPSIETAEKWTQYRTNEN